MTPAPEPEALFNAEIRQPAQICNSFVCVRSFIHGERSRKLWEEVHPVLFTLTQLCSPKSAAESRPERKTAAVSLSPAKVQQRRKKYSKVEDVMKPKNVT